MKTIAIIDLSTANGGDRFWRVARNMPDVQFTAVIPYTGDLTQVVEVWPNVTLINEADLDEVQGVEIFDIVLRPAEWPEDCELWIDLVRSQIDEPEANGVGPTAEEVATANAEMKPAGGKGPNDRPSRPQNGRRPRAPQVP